MYNLWFNVHIVQYIKDGFSLFHLGGVDKSWGCNFFPDNRAACSAQLCSHNSRPIIASTIRNIIRIKPKVWPGFLAGGGATQILLSPKNNKKRSPLFLLFLIGFLRPYRF